jgi:GTP-binding protein Era
VFATVDPPTQLAFVDTPGIAKPRTALHRALVDEARAGTVDADAVLVVTDVPARRAVERHPGDAAVLETARAVNAPIVVAINKVDRLADKSKLLPLMAGFADEERVEAVVPVSATTRDGLERLVAELRARMPEGLLYEDDVLTDKPERFFVAELIREAVIRHTRDEVPYGVAVQIDEHAELEGVTRIAATVIVEKDAHKGIVIGKGGARLKRIGSEARAEVEQLLGRKAHLALWVKVVRGWTGDPRRVRELTRETGG